MSLWRKLSLSSLDNGHDVCKLGEFIPIQSSGVYLFDVTKLCAVKSSCYDFSKETSWVNYMANIAAIDTPNSSWTSCNFAGEIKLVFAG